MLSIPPLLIPPTELALLSPLLLHLLSLRKERKTYLNNNMPRQAIDNHMLALQPQRLPNLLS